MSNERDDSDNAPLAADEQARIEARLAEHEIRWEAEATCRFGPADVRIRKNRRYAGRLIRRHSEQVIRGMLKALSSLDEPLCCAHLRHHDLEGEPLEQIIRPFELLGLHFSIPARSGGRFTVAIGEAYHLVGSGGEFLLELLDDGSFRVVETLSEWIA